MAYDERLAARIRTLVDGRDGISEKKMFGGIAFFVNGNLACGVLASELVVKVKGDEEAELLSRPGCRPFDFTGRPMRGIVLVEGSRCADDDELMKWIDPGLRAAQLKPAKQPKPKLLKAPKAQTRSTAKRTRKTDRIEG